MAVDAALWRRAEAAPDAPPLLRLYAWGAPTVSIGYHQRAARAVDLAACRRRQIPVVRRPTGGRAVLHHRELTYAVVARHDAPPFAGRSLAETYAAIHEAIAAGLRTLGAEVALAAAPRRAGGARERCSPRRTLLCFQSPCPSEILHRGRKLVGSAQRRGPRAFLQHGSIPLTVDAAWQQRIARQGSPAAGMAGLDEAAGRAVTWAAAARALVTGFTRVLGFDLRAVPLPPELATGIAPPPLPAAGEAGP